jgi:hypothetical protein
MALTENLAILQVRIYLTEFLATDPEVRVQFPELPHFLRRRGSGTQPREYNCGAAWKKK